MKPSVHFLNVGPGDCTIIRHCSGHVTMIDICDGNIQKAQKDSYKGLLGSVQKLGANPPGNFQMCESPTNPIEYVKNLGINNIHRFILTHPDMDHMDGLQALLDEIGITNFWHTGVERDPPEFELGSSFNKDDWNCYEKIRADKDSKGIIVLTKLAGARFMYANRNENDELGGDGLYILAPDKNLVNAASKGEDINDGSYVLLYRSMGGRVLIPGDAHDSTWKYVLENYESDVMNCSVMIAPHHGRKSKRSYDFLDTIKPKLTLFGCAPSKDLAYDAWNSRNLPKITSNQAGNVVLEIDEGAIDVYIENESFAEKHGSNTSIKNGQRYTGLCRILETPEN